MHLYKTLDRITIYQYFTETLDVRTQQMKARTHSSEERFSDVLMESCYEIAKHNLRRFFLSSQAYSLHKKSVLFVSQWSYHIDLQMMYAKPGVILLHSFLELKLRIEEYFKQFEGKFDLASCAARTNLKELYSINEENLKNFEPITENLSKRLQACGFKVVLVAGVCSPTVIQENGVVNGNRDQKSLNNFFFCFLNGFVLEPSPGIFEICIPASHEFNELQQYCYDQFETKCHEVGISQVHRIKIDSTQRTTENYMLETHGGLRCQVNYFRPKVGPIWAFNESCPQCRSSIRLFHKVHHCRICGKQFHEGCISFHLIAGRLTRTPFLIHPTKQNDATQNLKYICASCYQIHSTEDDPLTVTSLKTYRPIS